MSRYGELWEQCEQVRRRLRALSPDINTNTLREALDSSAELVYRLTALLEQWRVLEEQMSKQP